MCTSMEARGNKMLASIRKAASSSPKKYTLLSSPPPSHMYTGQQISAEWMKVTLFSVFWKDKKDPLDFLPAILGQHKLGLIS